MELPRRVLNRPIWLAVILALVYFCFGSAWILSSDLLVGEAFQTFGQFQYMSIVKGLIFVGLSSLLIFGLSFWGGQKLSYFALFDPATDLPNRTHFVYVLQEYLETARNDDQSVAVFQYEVEKIDHIQNVFGRKSAHRALQDVTRRIENHFPKGSTLARMGEWTFGVIWPNAPDFHRLQVMGRTVIDELETTQTIEGIRVRLSGNVGIAVCPEHGTFADQIEARAQMALTKIQRSRNGSVQIYSSNDSRTDPITIEEEFRAAVENGTLTLVYQPQVHLPSHQLSGWEALVRWHRTSEEQLPAKTVLQLAENTRTAFELDRWVLREAAHRIQRLNGAVDDNYQMAVNASVSSLIRSHHYLEAVEDILDATSVEPHWLEIEVTENEVLEEMKEAQDVLHALETYSIRRGIDDFGTGYASLQYLSDLPFNTLKIDQRFIQSLPEHQKNEKLVRTVLDLGTVLDLDVVAEGIDSLRQLKYLNGIECPYGQGYYFSRPIASDRLETFCRRFNGKTNVDRVPE